MALPESISGEFGMRAEGSDAFRDVEAGLSANDPAYTTKPRLDPIQTVRQIAQPDQTSANQPAPTATQAQAAEKRVELTSKAAGGMGAALSAGSSAQAGAARQETAQKAATKLATEVAKLDKVIAGEQPKGPSAGNKVAGAALGQGMNMAAAAAATVIAGPAAGALVGGAGMAYDVVKAFSGQSDGPSSFGTTNSRGEQTGYVASSSAQPASAPASVTNSFAQQMMNVPGERKINGGDIEIASAGLRGIEKAPPLAMTPAAVALAGVYKNGADVRAGQGDPKADKDDKLDFKPMDMKPNPGVFQAAAPKPFFG